MFFLMDSHNCVIPSGIDHMNRLLKILGFLRSQYTSHSRIPHSSLISLHLFLCLKTINQQMHSLHCFREYPLRLLMLAPADILELLLPYVQHSLALHCRLQSVPRHKPVHPLLRPAIQIVHL